MKKILIPFEGSHYPLELLDFAGTLQPIAPGTGDPGVRERRSGGKDPGRRIDPGTMWAAF